MRKRHAQKKFLLMSFLLIVVGLGIGYAILSQRLNISNSVLFDNMKWDVGFSSVADNGGTITSTSSISSDGKSITVNCDFGSSFDQESCIVKATIANNGTFNVVLTNDPIITYDDTYIHTLTFKWNNHPTYENHTVLKNNFIAKGKSEEVILTIKSKFLTIDTLPNSETTIPITITLNFQEWKNGELPQKKDLAVLKSTTQSDTTAFRSSTYKEKIKNITFEDKINIPNNATASWDIGVSQNGNVMAYVIPNQTDSTYYDLYIQSNTQLYANKDMSYWFDNLQSLDCINNLDLLNTSMTTNMYRMFSDTGSNSTIFTLNVSDFDTSKVTDMSAMFYRAGYTSLAFTLDVSNFDTSNVKNINSMFAFAGVNSPIFTLDVSNFNTSKVTDMYNLFNKIGYSNQNFTLDISNFDTSNVTSMVSMFADAGYKSTVFALDVSNFDTSNVTDMTSMFNGAGYSNPNFTLDVSNFDTSNVTSMGSMFNSTGRNSTIFTLNLSNFDTSKVTRTDYMFMGIGYNSTKLNISITIRNPNVTTYVNMFAGAATKSGSQITVNYTSETEALVDQMIATKFSNSNVVKGIKVQ